VGGAEKFLILLSNSLIHDTEKQVVISLDETNTLRHELDLRINFITLPRKFKFDIKPVLKLRKLIRNEQPDTIFCVNFYSYIITRCAMLGLKTRAKRIISYHSTIHVTKKEHWLHKLYAYFLTKKDSIITVSSNQAIYTSKKYRIPLRKFITIHNGINVAQWSLPPDKPDPRLAIREEYGIPLSAKVIVISAAFRPEKNHLGAINALQLLHSAYQEEAYLLLVGDGIMKEEIVSLTRQLKLEKFVKLAGMQKDVKPFYYAADLFSLCSTSVETFSIAALEAMSCGLPVVLTNIGGASEMVDENINGCLCEPLDHSIADAWHKCLHHGYHSKMIQRYVEDNFGSEKMVSNYKKILFPPDKKELKPQPKIKFSL
jgi:glycosyltransferase involved in cell wall biosynthesis